MSLKKEYSIAKNLDRDLRLFPIRCSFSLAVTSFLPEKKQITRVLLLESLFFFPNKWILFITKRSCGSARVSSVCLWTQIKMFPTWKKWSNILKSICNQKQTPEISPRTCSECVCVCVCVFVCVLNCQASRVDHPTDEEQGTRRVIPDQVKKGPVDSVGQVSWCRAEAWILVPLRCHLHDNLVVETGEFNGLTGDLLQLCVQ